MPVAVFSLPAGASSEIYRRSSLSFPYSLDGTSGGGDGDFENNGCGDNSYCGGDCGGRILC